MSKVTSPWADLFGGLLGVAREYVSDEVRISVKTNYGPEIPVATAALSSGDGGSSGQARGGIVAELLGVKAAVIVRNAAGDTISTFGEVPKTDPVRLCVALAIVGGLAWLIVRGALK